MSLEKGCTCSDYNKPDAKHKKTSSSSTKKNAASKKTKVTKKKEEKGFIGEMIEKITG